MRRRDLITLLGGAAAMPLLGPLAARAQQPALPVVGFLNTASPEPFAHLAAAFRKGLSDAGYTEGRNVAIEYRWAEGRYERLPALAIELISRPVAVLASTGGDPAILAARAATTTTPIVFATGSDPVALGYVASLNRPGGNLTGVTQLTSQLGAKRIGLLRELVPKADLIAVLSNPTFPVSAAQLKDAQEAAAAVGVRVIALQASAENEFEPAFATLVRAARRRADDRRRSVLQQPAPATGRAGGAPPDPHHLRVPRVCGGWRPDELRHQSCRRL